MLAQRAEFLVDGAGVLVALEDAVHNAMRDDRLMCRAGFQQLGRQAIQAAVTLVADDQTLVAIEHAQTVRHVFKRRIEPLIGALDRKLPPDAGGHREDFEHRHNAGGREKEPTPLFVIEGALVIGRQHIDKAKPEDGDDRHADDRGRPYQGTKVLDEA